jgi:hypothetical protein
MLLSASSVRDAWPELSTRFPPDLDLNALARSTKAVQRRRGDGIADGATLLQLHMAHGPGGLSLQETAIWAHLEGLAEIGPQSLNERLRRSVGFLSAILHKLLEHRTAGRPMLWAGRCLHIADGSSLSQRGSTGTDWRLHGVYDLGRGGFSHLEVTDKHGAESLLRGGPASHEVLIADRAYAKARQLWACLDPAGVQRRDVIVRIGWKSLVLRGPHGEPFDLVQQLRAIPTDAGPQEWAVQAVNGSARRPKPVPLRLIVLPLPPDKAATNQARLRRKTSKRQYRLNPTSLLAAGFMMLVTSLPADIPAAEIGAAYRLRWQIELAFKRLKSLLHLDRLPTTHRDSSLAWLLSHLILALLIEDTCQDLLDSFPSGARCRRLPLALAQLPAGRRRHTAAALQL